MLTRIKTLLASSLLVASTAMANDQVAEFFQNYVALGHNFDPAVAELYLDDSTVFAYQVTAEGETKQMTIPGKQWKQLIPTIMPRAKTAGDVSQYSNIEIVEVEGRFEITADRYSELKCYTDTDYIMIVAPTESGFKIAAEQMVSYAVSQCE